MLQAMRNKMHGWPSIIVLGIAVAAMSLFGMEGYLGGSSDTYVAKVGKREISQTAFQDRMNQLRQQLSAQQGEHFDSSIFEKPETKLSVLNGMIDQQLLLQANADWGMRVSDQALRSAIAEIPAFQVNGKFDATSYRAYLTSNGKTPDMFESEIRASLATQLVPQAISDSTIISDARVDDFLSLAAQRRDLRYFVLPKPEPADKQVTDGQIESWYKSHQAEYMDPEEISVKYVEVDAAKLKPEAGPSDEALKGRYAEEKQRFVQPEQRLVSHILINVPPNATPEQQKMALAKADKIAAEATPANFAKLAEQDSQDLGSQRQGGDLGWLEKGVTNAAFDSAMFSLQQGQISKPVLSSDGYHIIWLRNIRSGESKPFSEVRDQLVKEATKAARDHQYNELAGKMADQTYSNPSSLEPASVALGLPMTTTPLFSRTNGEGLTANPKVVAAAFSDDVLVHGNNSGLIDLGNNHSVVIHVDKHVPAAPKPLAVVRAQVRQSIVDGRVAAAAQKEAAAALARLRKGEPVDAVATSLGAKVVSAPGAMRGQSVPASVQVPAPAPVLKKAFLLAHPSAPDKPEFSIVDMGDGGVALLAVDKVQAGDLSKVTAEERDALRQQMAQAYGSEATRELLQMLRAKTKIKINKNLM
ncbi:MAG: SurA N-terminal domain-containing protein [Rhodanobacter sp.]